MSLSSDTCSNLHLSLAKIEAKQTKLLALLAEINISGDITLFNKTRIINQPMDEWVYIGMEPIESGGKPHTFSVGSDGGILYLCIRFSTPITVWFYRRDVVFRVRE